MFKRTCYLLFCLLFVAVSLNAQLLWKVSGNGLAKPSYLLGTHHLVESEQIPDLEKILSQITNVDAAVGEMDLGDKMGMQIKVMKAAMMKDQTIADLISAEDYALVDAEFKAVIGYGLKPLEKMKPMMLSSMYTVMAYMKQNNISKQPEAIDELVQKRAKKAKKEIVGLETIEQQADILFNSIPTQRQAEILVKAVKDKNKGNDESAKLTKAYLAGDLKQLEKIYADETDMTESERKILVDNRNANWMSQLKVMFQAKSCFVAVGCLHLVGEQGLIKQLQNAGYTVEAVQL